MHKHIFYIIFLALLLSFGVTGCSDEEEQTLNHAPSANAGVDLEVILGEKVSLDGSYSEDVDGDTLNYNWKITQKPDDSNVTLDSKTVQRPSFTADVAGVYSFSLVVDDGELSSKADSVNITFFKKGSSQVVLPSFGVQAQNEIYLPASATTYKQPMLVVLLSYNDVAITETTGTWKNRMFGSAQKGELNHYYNTISNSQFEFIAVGDDGNVSGGVVLVNLNYNHPGSETLTDSLTSASILSTEFDNALTKVATDGFDFSFYDDDNDGNISTDELTIVFIMAGEEEAYSGNTKYEKGVWAHVDCTSPSDTPQVSGVNVLGCQGGGKYAIFGENHYDNAQDFHMATVGIIAHELGHAVFDLPDLYYGSASRIGQYGLMGYGSWGIATVNAFPGSTPTHMTAWSKIKTGWYTSQQVHSDENMTIDLFATGDTAYNIIKTPLFNSSSEYFLLENRGTTGYDEALKMVKKDGNYVGGVAIWHIDADVVTANYATNKINASASHKGIDLEEAAGVSNDAYQSEGEPELNLFYSGNVDAFTPNSRPSTNLYDGSVTYLFVSEISVPGIQMSVKINNPSAQP